MKTLTLACTVSVSVVAVLAAIIASDYRIIRKPVVTTPAKATDDSVLLTKPRNEPSATPINLAHLPAALFMCRVDGTDTPEFFSLGTVSNGPEGPEVTTICRTATFVDPNVPYTVRVRLLNVERGDAGYFDHTRITSPHDGSGASNVWTFVLGRKPQAVSIPPAQLPDKTITYWNPTYVTERGGVEERLTSVTSLHSSKEFEVIGRAKDPNTGTVFVIIDFDPRFAIGGEGFIDSRGRRWVLVSDFSQRELARIHHDMMRLTGRSYKAGAVLLTGPLSPDPIIPGTTLASQP